MRLPAGSCRDPDRLHVPREATGTMGAARNGAARAHADPAGGVVRLARPSGPSSPLHPRDACPGIRSGF